MNYLDLLSDDVMKIINRELQNAHIIKRRIERKQNRKMNREQKRIAEHKRYLYEKKLPDYAMIIFILKELMNTINIY